jgi:hypothetical protein
MTIREVVALLRQRETDLLERSNAKMASIGSVSRREETEEQLKVRCSAQGDWEAAKVLRDTIEEIERG